MSNTRALLCELVASKIIRRFNEDYPGRKGLLLLANVLVAGFEPFQNAPEAIIRENRHALHWAVQRRGGYERTLTALEVAIISESKSFLSSSACQKVVEAIYTGRLVYTPTSFIDILPDHYKHKPISVYNPKTSPLLNHYRLIVPRTRNFLDICQFITLLTLFILVMENRDDAKFTTYELIFCIYAFGWTLDEFASMLEHGWQVYTQNLWSFLDLTFAIIYGVYLVLRLHGLVTNNDKLGQQALELLSTGAPVLLPRLAFNLMSENMLFVSLRAMMADFLVLTVLAVWCFAGFLLAMKWLGDGSHESITISKWMLWVWFGLDGTGIQRSVDFHWLLGPVLMVTFAFLGNTLFLTILVSMLSNTFSIIVSNVTAEIQFRRAVLTFGGVKSDAIFAYQPPFNILALCLMLPLKFVISPRWFHKVNVAAIRTINLPLLLIISAYERRSLWPLAKRKRHSSPYPHATIPFWDFSTFSVHGDIQAVFESSPPPSIFDQPNSDEDAQHPNLAPPIEVNNQLLRGRVNSSPGAPRPRRESRLDSVGVGAGLTDYLADMVQNIKPDSNIDARLEALEASTKRIEAMLTKLSTDLDDNGSEESGEPELSKLDDGD